MARKPKATPTDATKPNTVVPPVAQDNASPLVPAPAPDTPPQPPKVSFIKKYPRWVYPTAAFTALAAGGAVEMQTSFVQSRFFHGMAEGRIFARTRTSSPTVQAPAAGPYDERLGYTRSLEFRQRLTQERGYQVTGETQWIERSIFGMSLYPIYNSRSQNGLRITDDTNTTVYSASYPSRSFGTYDDIPQTLVNSLLFVENRELMREHVDTWNPAIEWVRTANVLLGRVPGVGNLLGSRAGGSTLATQIEKFRHSEGGVTGSAVDKLRQMLTASVRAYEHGPNTSQAREEIVLDYLNSMPLAAYPGFGEVNGFADGMSLWFGADMNEVNRLMRTPDAQLSEAELNNKAVAIRQAVSLVMSVKKPTSYLVRNRAELTARVDAYLPLMAEAGIISPAMRDRILATPLVFTDPATHERLRPTPPSKPIQSMRIDLMQSLGARDLYELNRLDISARTTLDGRANEAVTNRLRSLADPAVAAEHGLLGFRLLNAEMTDSVVYSFNLYERTPDGNNVLRVQTDNYNGALNLNEGSKLELGSTAKLRTLITYLQIISDVHARYAGKSPDELRAARQHDPLTRWTISHLLTPGADVSLNGTLNAAMERTYSANPGERFFTGGGIHTFGNFEGTSNGRAYTVRDALRNSVNLPFIRIMRDIRDHVEAEQMNIDPAIFTDPNHPQRRHYLEQFALQEGELFMYRGWARQRNLAPGDLAAHLAERTRKTPVQLAVVYRSLHPTASLEQMESFIRANCNNCGDGTNFERLYNDYAPGKFNLQDRAYLTRLHPMEIWIAEQRVANPNFTWEQAKEQSREERVEIYGWLLNSKNMAGQNNRIHTILEQEAFTHIHRYWQQVGFPFDRMTPSLGSALGAAGDTPAALAAMVGIIQNDGVSRDAMRFREITLGQGTPYEMTYRRPAPEGTRVLPAELTRIVRDSMFNVVENGTAIRARNSVTLSDGTVLTLGGKTGTGDNREGDNVKSRTATFVFVIDDRFYGTITAYVEGPEAARYRFTSSLASQIFKTIVPDIRPILDRSYAVTPRVDPRALPTPDAIISAPVAPATPDVTAAFGTATAPTAPSAPSTPPRDQAPAPTAPIPAARDEDVNTDADPVVPTPPTGDDDETPQPTPAVDTPAAPAAPTEATTPAPQPAPQEEPQGPGNDDQQPLAAITPPQTGRNGGQAPRA